MDSTEHSGHTLTFTARLKTVYKQLSNSRVVKNRETDDDALQHFGRLCNECLPCNEAEIEVKNLIKNLYKCNPTSFLSCIIDDPYVVLLIDARNMVIHFGIQNVVYIRWDQTTNSYCVEKNIRSPTASARFYRGRGSRSMQWSSPRYTGRNRFDTQLIDMDDIDDDRIKNE